MANPFSIIFGKEPINYIERVKEQNQIISDFISNPSPTMSYLIVGMRGSRKTVLMSNIKSYFDKQDNWIVVNGNLKTNILENIASSIYEKGKLKWAFLQKEFSFNFHGISLSLKGHKEISNIYTLIRNMLDILKKQNKQVLIYIDEIDNSREMKTFTEFYSSLLTDNYDIKLLMTGLYQNVSKLQDNKSLTFFYRCPKINLTPLPISSISLNYEKYLLVDENEALKLAKITKGYAYAYQVLGYLLFSKQEKHRSKETLNEFDNYLKSYVYDKIYNKLSKNEQKILAAFQSNNASKNINIRKNTDISEKAFSVYRDRLIKKGILFFPNYGMLEFSLPRFYEFLKMRI